MSGEVMSSGSGKDTVWNFSGVEIFSGLVGYFFWGFVIVGGWVRRFAMVCEVLG